MVGGAHGAGRISVGREAASIFLSGADLPTKIVLGDSKHVSSQLVGLRLIPKNSIQ